MCAKNFPLNLFSVINWGTAMPCHLHAPCSLLSHASRFPTHKSDKFIKLAWARSMSVVCRSTCLCVIYDFYLFRNSDAHIISDSQRLRARPRPDAHASFSPNVKCFKIEWPKTSRTSRSSWIFAIWIGFASSLTQLTFTLQNDVMIKSTVGCRANEKEKSFARKCYTIT